MPQEYSADFAEVYDRFFTSFADEVAPLIHDFHDSQPKTEHHREVLDLCCGTGQCARYFLDRGYRVTGVDLSAAMLARAAENAGTHLSDGSATFIQADVSDLDIAGRFGLVVSTFDALNHLRDESALEACIRSVAALLDEGGHFVFDLATRTGIERWNGTTVVDTEDTYLVRRGRYEGGPRAEATITGFIGEADGRYRRFEQQVHNHVFELTEVTKFLRRHGWRGVHLASARDLARAQRKPERQNRVFVVAQR